MIFSRMYDPIDSDFNNSWYTFFGIFSYTHAFPLLKTTSKVFDLGSYPIAYTMLELTFFKFMYSLQTSEISGDYQPSVGMVGQCSSFTLKVNNQV